LIGAFCNSNQLRFHAADGGGYTFLADQVLQLDPLNPQVAARLLAPLGPWRRFDASRQALMKAQLQRILDTGNRLSMDVYEIASKSLA
jgi:aminopeptidase N